MSWLKIKLCYAWNLRQNTVRGYTQTHVGKQHSVSVPVSALHMKSCHHQRYSFTGSWKIVCLANSLMCVSLGPAILASCHSTPFRTPYVPVSLLCILLFRYLHLHGNMKFSCSQLLPFLVLSSFLLFMRFVSHKWHLLGIAWMPVCVSSCPSVFVCVCVLEVLWQTGQH